MVPVVQVLDDSTCKATRRLVEDKVAEWRERGVNVQCICRNNRQGYKAGALKEVRHRQHECKATEHHLRQPPGYVSALSAEAAAAVPCAYVIMWWGQDKRACRSHRQSQELARLRRCGCVPTALFLSMMQLICHQGRDLLVHQRSFWHHASCKP